MDKKRQGPTGRIVNIKKGQFLAPDDMKYAVAKVVDAGNPRVLITERLVVTIEVERGDGLPPATPWYPQRSQLVRNLEAARHLADGKRFASLVLSRRPLPDAAEEQLERTLPTSAPHLDQLERRELHDAYLGNLTWDGACDAVDMPRDWLPDAIAETEVKSET